MTQVLVTEDSVGLDESKLEDDIHAALDLHRHDSLLVGLLHIDVGVGTMEYVHGAAVTRAVLQEVGFRIDRAIRRTDARAHVRFGQFVVVLPGLGTQGDLQLVAEGVYKALREPYMVAGQSIDIPVHLGAALTSSAHRRVNGFLRNAAMAAHEAQRRHVPLHISGSLFGSISRRLGMANARSRRGDRGEWGGRRMARQQRATTSEVA